MKKNTTSSSGRIPKNKIPVVWVWEMDQVVSLKRDDIHQRKIRSGDQNRPKDQFAIMPENICAE